MEEKFIVLTGSPGCGKDGVLEAIPGRLKKETDWYPIVIPEAATMVSVGGVGNFQKLKEANFKRFLAIQEEVFKLDNYLLEYWRGVARSLGIKKCVFFKNRGELDISVYTRRPHFMRMLQSHGSNLAKIRERYHGVIILDPPGKFYTRANNKARTENAGRAAALDLPTKHAWIGHPHYWVVKSTEKFEDKIDSAYRAVLNILGTEEIERRFQVLNPPDWSIRELRHAQFARLRQRYIHWPTGKSGRIRRRIIEEDGSMVYHCTQKSAITAVKRGEIERDILYAEYQELKRLMDPDTRVIRKTRGHFLWGSQHWECDRFRDFPGLTILECELLREDDPVVIPPFLGEIVEVTDDKRFRNSAIAKLDWKFPN